MPTNLYNQHRYLNRRRRLRRFETKEERWLWRHLRGKRFHQIKFFRQYGVGPYILDFFCPKFRLAVEIDGGQHNLAEYKRYDERRTQYLNRLNIRVVRFWNYEVRIRVDLVLRQLEREMGITPSRPPSYSKREELNGGGERVGGDGKDRKDP